jgi:hypothetical protein
MPEKIVGYDMLQLSHRYNDENETGYDFEALQHHFQKSLNKSGESTDDQDSNCMAMHGKRFESSIDVNKIDTEPVTSSNLRHSRTLSMPAIASSQLSDISERSEFISHNQSMMMNAVSSNDVTAPNRVEPSDVKDNDSFEPLNEGQINRKSSIHSLKGTSDNEPEANEPNADGSEQGLMGESSIEINVQRASTISEE